MGLQDPLRRSSLVDEAAERLRQAILEGLLEGGQRLHVSRLAEDWGVSHIPMREACRRLEAEGLLESVSHGSPKVASLSESDLTDVYSLRMMLESPMIRQACGQHSEGQLRRLGALLETLNAEADEGPDVDYWRAHREFHRLMLEPAMTPWRERILVLLWGAAERYRRFYAIHLGGLRAANKQHQRTVEILRAGDGAALEALHQEHLMSTMQGLQDGFRAAAGRKGL